MKRITGWVVRVTPFVIHTHSHGSILRLEQRERQRGTQKEPEPTQELIKHKSSFMCLADCRRDMQYTQPVTSITLLLLQNVVFSPSAFGHVKPLVDWKGENIQYDWLPLLFSPFCCYGWHIPSIDAIPTLWNCHWFSPYPATISSPSLSLFQLSLIDSLHVFVSAPFALTSI